MNGKPASSNRASAVDIFAICISEIAPSCMRATPDLSLRNHDGVEHSGIFLHPLQPIDVTLGVDKFQRIGRCQPRVVLAPLLAIERQPQSFLGIDSVMVPALRADVEVLVYVTLE